MPEVCVDGGKIKPKPQKCFTCEMSPVVPGPPPSSQEISGSLAENEGETYEDRLKNLEKLYSKESMDEYRKVYPLNTIYMTMPDVSRGMGSLNSLSKIPSIFKNFKRLLKFGNYLPSIDRTGKVHGSLPKIKDLNKFSKEELEVFLIELTKSVQRRIKVTSRMGRDRGHGQRQEEEQDLIKAIEKYLKDL